MSSNAIAAVAVVLVSGFAGCAATARAVEPVSIALPAVGARAVAAQPAAALRAVATPDAFALIFHATARPAGAHRTPT